MAKGKKPLLRKMRFGITDMLGLTHPKQHLPKPVLTHREPSLGKFVQMMPRAYQALVHRHLPPMTLRFARRLMSARKTPFTDDTFVHARAALRSNRFWTATDTEAREMVAAAVIGAAYETVGWELPEKVTVRHLDQLIRATGGDWPVQGKVALPFAPAIEDTPEPTAEPEEPALVVEPAPDLVQLPPDVKVFTIGAAAPPPPPENTAPENPPPVAAPQPAPEPAKAEAQAPTPPPEEPAAPQPAPDGKPSDDKSTPADTNASAAPPQLGGTKGPAGKGKFSLPAWVRWIALGLLAGAAAYGAYLLGSWLYGVVAELIAAAAAGGLADALKRLLDPVSTFVGLSAIVITMLYLLLWWLSRFMKPPQTKGKGQGQGQPSQGGGAGKGDQKEPPFDQKLSLDNKGKPDDKTISPKPPTEPKGQAPDKGARKVTEGKEAGKAANPALTRPSDAKQGQAPAKPKKRGIKPGEMEDALSPELLAALQAIERETNREAEEILNAAEAKAIDNALQAAAKDTGKPMETDHKPKVNSGGIYAQLEELAKLVAGVDKSLAGEINDKLNELLTVMDEQAGEKESPRYDGEKLVHEIVSIRYNLTRAHRAEMQQIEAIGVKLLMVDVSGSCEKVAKFVLAAAAALLRDHPRLVLVTHSNGHPEKVYGHMATRLPDPSSSGDNMDGLYRWWDAFFKSLGPIAGAVNWGDWDAGFVLQRIAERDIPLVWLDHNGSGYGVKEAEARLRERAKTWKSQPVAWYQGIHDALSTVMALRLATRDAKDAQKPK